MIGKDQIAAACRHIDAISEEQQDFRAYMAERGVDAEGLTYIALQRALRAAMILNGQDPTKLSRTEFTPVSLPRELEAILPNLAALFIDGFAVRMQVDKEVE